MGLGADTLNLAFAQIARIAAAHQCAFILQLINSVELTQLRGRSPFQGAPVPGKYEWAYRRKDAEAWAKYYRVALVEPKPFREDHRLMARVSDAAGMQGTLRCYCLAMFKAGFVDNEHTTEQACI